MSPDPALARLCDERFVHALEHRDDVRTFTEPDDGLTVTLHAGELVEVRLTEHRNEGIQWQVADLPPCLRELGEVYDPDGGDLSAELDADPDERVFIFQVQAGEGPCRLRLAAHQTDEDGQDGYVDGFFELDIQVRPASHTVGPPPFGPHEQPAAV